MNVKEVLPKEGVTGWSDSWMLSNEGQAPDLRLQVHELRDHAGRCRLKVADVTGYSPAEPEDL